MATRITKRLVDRVQPEGRDRFTWDTEIKGFCIKITPQGRKVFVLVYRFPRGRAGRVRRYTIGTYGSITPDQARAGAKRLAGEISQGIDPMARLQAERKAADAERRAPRKTFEAIARRFVEQHHKVHNRTWAEAERLINRHLVTRWRLRRIDDIRRGEINDALDEIERDSGPTTAQSVLKQLSKMFNWHAVRDERFVSPIVRGMTRISIAKRRRTRTLNDEEIRVVWEGLNASPAPFRQLLRFLLVTAQRRGEASGALQSDILEGIWRIPPERYKTAKPHVVPLTELALAQIKDLGEIAKRGRYIFTTTGDKPYQGHPKAKRELDAEIERILRARLSLSKRDQPGPLMPHWQIHDLRRTAKTLMQRAKVRPDVSERVLGHVIAGVEGTYDQYDYLDEKHDALERLANEMTRILNATSAAASAGLAA